MTKSLVKNTMITSLKIFPRIACANILDFILRNYLTSFYLTFFVTLAPEP